MSLHHNRLFMIIMSSKRKWSILPIKGEQSKVWFCQLNKRKERKEITYKWAEYGVSKQEISNICNNKEKTTKFANNLRETSEGMKWKSLQFAQDEQLYKVLFHDLTLLSWFSQLIVLY